MVCAIFTAHFQIKKEGSELAADGPMVGDEIPVKQKEEINIRESQTAIV